MLPGTQQPKTGSFEDGTVVDLGRVQKPFSAVHNRILWQREHDRALLGGQMRLHTSVLLLSGASDKGAGLGLSLSSKWF